MMGVDDARADTKSRFEAYSSWLASIKEMKALYKAWLKCSPETRQSFEEAIAIVNHGRRVDMALVWSDLSLFTSGNKYLRLAEVLRPLVECWAANGNRVSKTLASQNPTKKAGGGDSDAIKFLCGEYKELSGRRLPPSTARTILTHMGY